MSDHSIHLEYNLDLEPLEDLLSSVEQAGDFCVSGAVEIPMPKIEVEGVGVLSFPVPPTQVAALIQEGRGEGGRFNHFSWHSASRLRKVISEFGRTPLFGS